MSVLAKRAIDRSALPVVRLALQVATEALPPYSSKFSKQAYTQPQLLALLLLKQFFQADYRGLVQVLHERSDVRRALRLHSVPHYSTLAHAAKRWQNEKVLHASWRRFLRRCPSQS